MTVDHDHDAAHDGAQHADGEHGHDDGYEGTVTIHLADPDRDITVRTTLRGYFEPLDGRYHWYGRLAADPDLTAAVGSGKLAARVTTAHATTDCQLGDVDPWGRLRISGVSTPPFPIARTLEDVEGTD